MAFKPFTTHTGLLVYVEKPQEKGGNYTVCIAGDRVKELLATPVRTAAEKYAKGIQKQYEESV